MKRSLRVLSVLLALTMVIPLLSISQVFADVTDTESDGGKNTNKKIEYSDQKGVIVFAGDKKADGTYNPIDLKNTMVNVECSQRFKGTTGCSGGQQIGQAPLESIVNAMKKQSGSDADWSNIAMAGFRYICAKNDPGCSKPILYTTDKRPITKEEMKCTNTKEAACKDWNEKGLYKIAWDKQQAKGTRNMSATMGLGLATGDMPPDKPPCVPQGESVPGKGDFKCCEPPNDKNNPPGCKDKPNQKDPPEDKKKPTNPDKPSGPNPPSPGNPPGGGPPQDPNETFYCNGGTHKRYINQTTEGAGTGFVKGPSHVRATLDPVSVPDLSSLDSRQQAYWYQTHVSQKAPIEKTPYGKYLEKNKALLASLIGMGKSGGIGEASNYRRSWETFLAGAKAAIAEGVQLIKIDFNSANQIGYARGGAWTFTEWRKDTQVTANHNQDYYDKQDCEEYTVYERVWNPWTWEYDYEAVKKERVIIAAKHIMIDGNYTKEDIKPVESRNYYPYKSYQVINVRCNQDEFATLMGATGSTVFKMGPAASSGISPIIKMAVANFYNGLGVDFYYSTKGCEDVFRCTGEINPGARNDSAHNVQDNGPHVNGLYGAQSDGKSSSRFSFFRDNVSKEIRNDVWWLNPYQMTFGDWNFDTKKPAEATFITMDTNATPLADMFHLEDANKSVLLTGADLSSGDNALLFRDQRNVFNWRASWASERAKPHKMNTRYAYKPKSISHKTPGILNRKGVASNNVNEEVVDMYCDVKYNTTQKDIPIISNLPREDEYKPIKEFVEDRMRNLIVQFVKSSAE